MNSVLTRNEIEAGFTLLAWRGMAVAAEPGLRVHVRSGVLRADWPEAVPERLSPGLEPITLEPLALMARP